MNALDILLQAFAEQGITAFSVHGHTIQVPPGFEIEIEPNGLYKLTENSYTVAPFRDAYELCRVMLG